MTTLSSSDIRARFLAFFKARAHAILPSASLVPENDPSVLFNTAGMQPLVPYLMGQKHPLGTRLASSQKCVRTGDIEEVGNHKNLTFFEMLGNWSLGDYFKEDAIKWSYEFLTSKEEGLGLDPARLYVTVFEGDEDAPRDLEAVEIWKNYIPENRIYFLPKKNNWWSPGDNGPCGPDTEMFYDVTPNGLGDMTHDEYVAADDDGRVVEIWNDVFMEYEKKDGLVIGKLAQKNVDTGSGLERITMIVQGKSNVYDSDLFAPVMNIIKDTAGDLYDEKSARIIADHVKASAMLIADGVRPSNKDQGYVLRRLIRRAAIRAKKLGFFEKMEPHAEEYEYSYNVFSDLLSKFFELYEDTDYLGKVSGSQVSSEKHLLVLDEFKKEVEKFSKTLELGLKEFEKNTDPFVLATTYGFPIELTEELAAEKGVAIDRAGFDAKMKAHQDLSRSGSAEKFKGGLANTNETTVKLHTAHHLLLAALQEVLGKEVKQKGSNITEERLRIDFNFDRKVTPEELAKVESLVNGWIAEKLPVMRREMPREEAEALGAEMEFGAKYPDIVSVYTVQKPDDAYVSKEFCGGPHVTNTGDIGVFKIQKEEASSAGIRRIKAVLS
ncbi:MAG: alanyl-tRNA synthetase, alanyl-tRNA synthetase [Patescibacteria group bacterium]|nr:alanyl-tRNA synthetase, alanyl-tRNA synthetase [Patescibacteria group bacterium]